MFIYRLWQIRRVVWSKRFIAFANIGESSSFDAIPFAEVSSVEQLNDSPRSDSTAVQPMAEGPALKSADSAKTLFRHAVQIKTDADGYNSGRTYYLQASSAEQCAELCASLAVLARRARKAVVAGTRFRRLQTKVPISRVSRITESKFCARTQLCVLILCTEGAPLLRVHGLPVRRRRPHPCGPCPPPRHPAAPQQTLGGGRVLHRKNPTSIALDTLAHIKERSTCTAQEQTVVRGISAVYQTEAVFVSARSFAHRRSATAREAG
jgi:hypothetical protein